MNFAKVYRRILALMLAAAMLLTFAACRNKEPDPTEPEQTTGKIDYPEDNTVQSAFLGSNLYITDIGKYTGAYMEDGSDEIVTDVLMVVLKNDNDTALQLARINLQYADFTANFEVTNLPAGESVVLLEKNRHEYVSQSYLRATVENVSFFQNAMSLQEDKIKITGDKGLLTIENLTDETLGEIYIYYKNSAVDLYYGGITYRARVDAGLKPGKSTTVMTNHYYPNACTILDVQIMPVQE